MAFFTDKIFRKADDMIFSVSLPETWISAIAPIQLAVARAQIVSVEFVMRHKGKNKKG